MKQFENKRALYHKPTVQQIRDRFGSEHVYTNDNGHPAISKLVLKHFSRLKGDRIFWDRRRCCWRVRNTNAVVNLSRLTSG
jgi:hypothetical protein